MNNEERVSVIPIIHWNLF